MMRRDAFGGFALHFSLYAADGANGNIVEHFGTVTRIGVRPWMTHLMNCPAVWKRTGAVSADRRSGLVFKEPYIGGSKK